MEKRACLDEIKWSDGACLVRDAAIKGGGGLDRDAVNETGQGMILLEQFARAPQRIRAHGGKDWYITEHVGGSEVRECTAGAAKAAEGIKRSIDDCIAEYHGYDLQR